MTLKTHRVSETSLRHRVMSAVLVVTVVLLTGPAMTCLASADVGCSPLHAGPVAANDGCCDGETPATDIPVCCVPMDLPPTLGKNTGAPVQLVSAIGVASPLPAEESTNGRWLIPPLLNGRTSAPVPAHIQFCCPLA